MISMTMPGRACVTSTCPVPLWCSRLLPAQASTSGGAGALPPAPPCCRLLPAAEGDVGDAAGAVYGLDLEAVFERLQPIPQPFPAAQHDRHHDDVRVVDQAGGQEFADGGRAAADADVRPAAAWRACASAWAGLASRK